MIPANSAAIARDIENLCAVVQDFLNDIERLDVASFWLKPSKEADDARMDIDVEILDYEQKIARVLSILGQRLALYADALQLAATRESVTQWRKSWTDRLGKTEFWHDSETHGRESPAFNEIKPVLDGLLVLLQPDQKIPPTPVDRVIGIGLNTA